MTITDEDCLPETLAFNARFEAAAADRPARGRALDAGTLALLRRNRLAGAPAHDLSALLLGSAAAGARRPGALAPLTPPP